MILMMWAHPRSLSTAFERMMMERSDFLVFHEPFCTLYDTGRVTLRGVRGAETTLTDYDELIDFIGVASAGARVFIKETCEYHYAQVLAREEFLRAATHTFIIREPRKTISSHFKMNPNVTRDEIGYGHLWELHTRLAELGVAVRAVVDADRMLVDTEDVVSEYCRRVGIEFQPAALSWNPMMPHDWERTALWHADAISSAGIREIERNYDATVDTDDRLRSFYDWHLPIYQKLKALG